MIAAPQRLPDPQIPWFDPKSGRPTPAFYQYMRELDGAMRKLIAASNDYETRITDLETP